MKLFFAFLFSLLMTAKSESECNELISETIKASFKNYYCVTITVKPAYNFVAGIISKMELFSVIYDSSDFICDGHIFAGVSMEKIKNIIESNAKYRQKHNRILFIQSEGEDEEGKNLRKLSLSYDLEMIEISLKLSQIKELIKTEEKFYCRKNITFIRNSLTTTYKQPKSNKLHFKKQTWKPQTQREFRISLFHCPPHVIYNNKTSQFTGNEYRILQEVTKDWKTKLILHEKSRNSWTEVRSDLKSNKSDLGLCSHFLLFALQDNLAFSYPFDVRCLTFIVPKPNLLPDLTFVFQPMQLNLWILILLALLLFASFCFLLLRITGSKTDFTFVLLLVFRSIVANAMLIETLSKKSSLRQIFLFWSLTSLLLVTAYNSGISSVLTYPRHTKPIRSLSDMIVYNTKIHGSRKSIRDILESPLEEISKLHVASFANDDASMRSSSDARCVTESNGFIANTEDMGEYGKRRFNLVSGCLTRFPVVFPFSRDSLYIGLFDGKLRRLDEHGFLVRWRKELLESDGYRYLKRFREIGTHDYVGYGSLSVSKVEGAFVVLISGVLVAIGVFIYEVIKGQRLMGVFV